MKFLVDFLSHLGQNPQRLRSPAIASHRDVLCRCTPCIL